MQILRCEAHAQAEYREGLCLVSDLLPNVASPCRIVPMRLIPDNAETVERLAQMVCRQPANTEGHNLECRDFAVAILAALDGETP